MASQSLLWSQIHENRCLCEIGLDAGSGSRQPFEPACASFTHLRLVGPTRVFLSAGKAGNLSSATEVPEASEATDHVFFPEAVSPARSLTQLAHDIILCHWQIALPGSSNA
jgi:hypothetical protein